MNEWTLYYNPQCGTCRNVKERLETRGVKPRLVEYLKTPPSAQELEEILKKMGAEPAAITRMKDPVIEEKGLRFEGLSRKAWIQLIADNPSLLQRPIAVRGDRAVVARPPEAVDVLLT
jgi:arsenate reductase (glutaredoxin)